jgi:hypothetical protein
MFDVPQLNIPSTPSLTILLQFFCPLLTPPFPSDGNLPSMKTSLLIANALFMAVLQTASAESNLEALARQAVSTNSSRSATAIEQLRAAGPSGLDAMFRVYGERIQKQHDNPVATDADWPRLRTAFDAIAQQRDAYASHLYWYTDLGQAKAAASASGKPILSLRLLGKLNEEYSCANSRFFRTTLYPNAEVSRYLRDHFILHWQSVRPVPRITIDMGDGRRIERTITGNSIHYILDANGNPIDALPGLYGARAFLTELDHAVAAEQQASKLSGSDREHFLANYHATRLAQIQQQFSTDLAIINQTPTAYPTTSTRSPDAIAAVPRAISKTAVERPMLRSGAESVLALDRNRLDLTTADSLWQKIAELHNDQAALDSSSVRLIQLKQPPTAAEATRITASKAFVETPMLRMLRNLQRSIAEDTVQNEYQLHASIHGWFANGTAPANLEALNSKIYTELFLTPNSDNWLGLAPAEVYSALDGGGLVQTKTPQSK